MAARGSTPPGDGAPLDEVPGAERRTSKSGSGRRRPAPRAAVPEQALTSGAGEDADASSQSGPKDGSESTPTSDAASGAPRNGSPEGAASGGEAGADGAGPTSGSDPDALPEQPAASAAAPPSASHGAGRNRGAAWRDRVSRDAIGIAVLVVLAVVCAALIVAVVVKTREEAAAAAREAAAYQPPALSAPTPASTGPTVAIVSDEGALRSGSGVGAAQRWPQLLAENDDVTTIASAGAGYATAGANEATFIQSAGRIPADADVVLFVGGAADYQESSLSLARAATQAFSAATEQAPDATIVAVGPFFRPSGTSEADLSAVRTTLRSAARIAGLRWVDPIASGWVTGVAATGDLTASKERALASRLGTLVRGAIG